MTPANRKLVIARAVVLLVLYPIGLLAWLVWSVRWTNHTRRVDTHNIIEETDWYTTDGDDCGIVWSSPYGEFAANAYYRWPNRLHYFSDRKAAERYVEDVCR